MAMKKIKSGDKYAIYQMDDKHKTKLIYIENVRLSFSALGRMREDKDEDTGHVSRKYKGSPMLEKGKHDDARAAFNQLMKELMEQNDVKIPSEFRCIKDGDESEREEYQGHWIISASETKRPIARKANGDLFIDPEMEYEPEEMEALLDKIDEVIYSGCYVNILLRPWYFNGTVKGKTKKFPKRICCGLAGVQYFRKGEPFSQGRIDDSAVDWSGGGSGDDDDDLDDKPKSNKKPKRPADDDDDDL